MAVSRRALVPLLVVASFGMLGAAWLVATPPGSGLDEPAHFVKAVGVATGQPHGEARVLRGDRRRFLETAKRDPEAIRQFLRASQTPGARWQERTRRRFRVAPELLRPSWGCTFGQPRRPATCVRTDGPSPSGPDQYVDSYVGTYQPYAYVAPGLAIRAAAGPELGLRLARAVNLTVALGLLAAAAALLWSPAGGALSLVGLLAAVTPMVLFVASSLTPSSLEVSGAICFSAALLRLARDEPGPRRLWWALAGSGVVLALARSLGPAFVAAILLTVVVLAGPRTMLRRLHAGGRAATLAGAAILAAIAACAGWQLAYQPSPAPSGGGLRDALRPSFERLDGVGQEAIGILGTMDAPLPAWGYALWIAILVALGAAALGAGDRRERASIVALLAAVVGVTLAMSLIYREIGLLHGRYALPYLVLLGLWPAEIVLRRRDRLPTGLLRALAPAVLGTAATVQMLAWWTGARRFAVGDEGRWLFFADASWSPPLGWWPWLATVVAATVASLLAAALALRPPERARSG